MDDRALLNTSLLFDMFRSICRRKGCYRIFFAIGADMNLEDNTYYGTLRQIAERARISKSTASRAMKLLCESGIVKKVAKSVWQLNTDIIVPRNDPRYENIMQEFEQCDEILRTE